MIADRETELVLPPNSLAVFIDETGHEQLPNGHMVYGIGGCAVLEQDLERLLRAPWKAIRKALLGNEADQLHASAISRTLSGDKKALIGDFFKNTPFMRIAVAVTAKTIIPERMDRLRFMAPSLAQRILNVFKWTRAETISLIFESNERADLEINRAFGSIKIGEDGNEIPFKGYFMPKSVGDPALEIADFIMHAVHGLAYDIANGRDGYARRDFRAVFQTSDKKLSDFMLIEKVEISQPGAPV